MKKWSMFVGEMMGNGIGTSSPMPWAGKPGKRVHMYEASIGCPAGSW